MYSRDQIDQLRYAQNLMGSGLHAAEAHRLLGARLAEGMTLVPASTDSGTNVFMIMLAERDVYAAELIEYLLRTEGYTVVVAFGADETIRLYHQRHPDLVLVELVRPGRSGLELCRELSSAGATVIAVSALDIRAEAIAAGAAVFLLKPLASLRLLSAVKDLLGQSALSRPREAVL